MSTIYSRGRIRLLLDVTSREPALDVTGSSPSIWRGTDLAVELAFANGVDGLIDISPYSSITVEVRDLATRTSVILATRTLAAAALSPALTLDQWNAGTGQHGSWIWTKDETRWDLGGQTERLFWIVAGAITNDTVPRQVTLGASILRVVEDGIGDVANSPVPGDPLYLTAAQTMAAIGQVIRPGNNPPGMTILLTSPNGQWGRLIGVDDQGAATDTIIAL